MLMLAQSHNALRKDRSQASGQARRRAGQGFTLIELLLVVALVMMLMGAMVFNFSTLVRGNQLQEGTDRLETLMRFARAQAANSGRKVQLVFSPESTNTPAASTGEVRATWEPDPLKQPGCYQDLGEAQFHVKEINNLVQVESVTLLDASTACPPTDCVEDEFEEEFSEIPPAHPLAPITFYPDGSSDSAELIVASRSTEEEQRMAVRLVGITGSISHQLLSAEFDETLDESGLPQRYGQSRRDGSTIRDMQTEREPAPRPFDPWSADSSSRAVPTAPRSPIGETNSVDRAE